MKRSKVGISYEENDDTKVWLLGRALKKAGFDFYDYKVDRARTIGKVPEEELYEIYMTECDYVVGVFSEPYFGQDKEFTPLEFDALSKRLRNGDENFLVPVIEEGFDLKSKNEIMAKLSRVEWSKVNTPRSCLEVVDVLIGMGAVAVPYTFWARWWKTIVIAIVLFALAFGAYSFLPLTDVQIDPSGIVNKQGRPDDSVGVHPGEDDPQIVIANPEIEVIEFPSLCEKDWDELKTAYDTLTNLSSALGFMEAVNRCLTIEKFQNGTEVYFVVTSEPSPEEIKYCKGLSNGDTDAYENCLKKKAKTRAEFERASFTFDFKRVDSEVVKVLTEGLGIIRSSGKITSTYIMEGVEQYGKHSAPYKRGSIPTYVILIRK